MDGSCDDPNQDDCTVLVFICSGILLSINVRSLMSAPQILKLQHTYLLILAFVLSVLSSFVNTQWIYYFEVLY